MTETMAETPPIQQFSSIREYDYELPKELIAQEPAKERDQSRLLVYHMKGAKPNHFGQIEHKRFVDLVDILSPGDVLVVNETKVVRTLLKGHKKSGGSATITIVKPLDEHNFIYDVFVKCKNPKIGTEFVFGDKPDVRPAEGSGEVEKLTCRIIDKLDERFAVQFDRDPRLLLEREGDYTLPGYIKNTLYDRDRYQTLFALKNGSIAAPTAGLHFSDKLIKQLSDKGVIFVTVCLHVGIGTFKEIEIDDYTKHDMDKEWIEVSEEAAEKINHRKGRLFVVGTTTLRALETATAYDGVVRPYKGYTNLFIYPGYKFKLGFSGFITNFHPPRSTPLLLVSAIIGPSWKRIYAEAIRERYRFYSFGDAMLILR